MPTKKDPHVVETAEVAEKAAGAAVVGPSPANVRASEAFGEAVESAKKDNVQDIINDAGVESGKEIPDLRYEVYRIHKDKWVQHACEIARLGGLGEINAMLEGMASSRLVVREILGRLEKVLQGLKISTSEDALRISKDALNILRRIATETNLADSETYRPILKCLEGVNLPGAAELRTEVQENIKRAERLGLL